MSSSERDNAYPWRRLITGIVAILLIASAVRLWLYEEPGARFDPKLPDNVTFQYAAHIETENVWHWVEAPAIPVETGQAVLKLLEMSERSVVEGEWVTRLNRFPPIYKSYPLVSPVPPNATLKVLSAGTEDRILWIDFIGRDNGAFLSNGWFVVPEENLPALNALLDSLDTQCEEVFRHEQREMMADSHDVSDQEATSKQPGEE